MNETEDCTGTDAYKAGFAEGIKRVKILDHLHEAEIESRGIEIGKKQMMDFVLKIVNVNRSE